MLSNEIKHLILGLAPVPLVASCHGDGQAWDGEKTKDGDIRLGHINHCESISRLGLIHIT